MSCPVYGLAHRAKRLPNGLLGCSCGFVFENSNSLPSTLWGPAGHGTNKHRKGALGIDRPMFIRQLKYGQASLMQLTKAADIFLLATSLKQLTLQYGDTIVSRWQAKSRDKRLKILLDAWKTEMNQYHRPDLHIIRNKPSYAFNSETKNLDLEYFLNNTLEREAFLMPYINQEDLLKPRNLELLLWSRSQGDPCEFAHADAQAMRLFGFADTYQTNLGGYVMVFTGRNTVESYGQLLSIEDDPQALSWYFTLKEPHVHEGMLILEAQARVMAFLVDCVKLILHDLPLDRGSQHIQTPQLGLNLQYNAADIASHYKTHSLSAMANEAIYQRPKELDFAKISLLLLDRYNEAVDHLWEMRQDPSVFEECLTLQQTHHISNTVPKVSGLVSKIAYLRSTLGNTIYLPVEQVEIWHSLQTQATKLKLSHQFYVSQITPYTDLPEPLVKEIMLFYGMVQSHLICFLLNLRIKMPSSPPWRLFIQHCGKKDPTRDVYASVWWKPIGDWNDCRRQTMELFRMIWERREMDDVLDIYDWVDELNRHLDSYPEAKTMTSSMVASLLSDISILADCLRQLDMFQPWARTFGYAFSQYRSEVEKHITQVRKQLKAFYAIVQHEVQLFADNGRVPVLYYPVAEAASRERAISMRIAERNLAKIWATFDEKVEINMNTGKIEGKPHYLKLLENVPTPKFTPRWIEVPKQTTGLVEPGKPKGPKKTPKQKQKPSTKATDENVADILADLQLRTESTQKPGKISPAAKAKVKSRPTQDPLAEVVIFPVEFEDALPNIDIPEQSFKVDKTALKVFKTLFSQSSPGATPGHFSWKNFCHAMNAVGFRDEQRQGSHCRFISNTRRNIVFHRPHPDSKIPSDLARHWGDRLARVYNWNASMFISSKDHAPK